MWHRWDVISGKKSFLHNKFEIVVAFRLLCFHFFFVLLYQYNKMLISKSSSRSKYNLSYDKSQRTFHYNSYEYIRLLCSSQFFFFLHFFNTYKRFFWSLPFRVPITTKNWNNYRSPEIDILLVLNQLIIHVLAKPVFYNWKCRNRMLNTKCP